MIHSPFKFLDSYTKEDSSIFFGREQETEDLYRKIFENKTLLVYGVSGTGKTSIINCGLANKFNEADWLPVTIRRNQNMVESFYAALHKLSPDTKDKGKRDAKAFIKLLQSVYLDHFKPVYLLFDQFEELFIFGDEEEQKTFVDIIAQIKASDVQVKILFIMREEYLANMSAFEEKIPDMLTNRLRIEKMSTAKVKEAITGPCNFAEISIDNEAVETIIEKLTRQGKTIELTYLQVLLDRLFHKAMQEQKSDNLQFTQSLVASLGEVSDILGDFLEEQIRRFDNPDQVLDVLKSFVSIRGTKRQSTVEEIGNHLRSLNKAQETDTLQTTIQQLVNLRILREKDENDRYELRHDALAMKIYEKVTLVEKELIEVRDFLENALNNFQKRGRLLSVEDLKYIAPYEEKMFLSTDMAKLVENSKREVTRKKRIRRRIIGSLATVIIIVLSILVFWAVNERNKALREKQKAKASNFNFISKDLLPKDATKAYYMVKQAYRLDSTNQQIAENIQSIPVNNDFYTIVELPFPDLKDYRKFIDEQNKLVIIRKQLANSYFYTVLNENGKVLRTFEIKDLGLDIMCGYGLLLKKILRTPDYRIYTTKGKLVSEFSLNDYTSKKSMQYITVELLGLDKIIYIDNNEQVIIAAINGNLQYKLNPKKKLLSSDQKSVLNDDYVLLNFTDSTSSLFNNRLQHILDFPAGSHGHAFYKDLLAFNCKNKIYINNLKEHDISTFKFKEKIARIDFLSRHILLISSIDGIIYGYSIKGKELFKHKTGRNIRSVIPINDIEYLSLHDDKMLLWKLKDINIRKINSFSLNPQLVDKSFLSFNPLDKTIDDSVIAFSDDSGNVTLLNNSYDTINNISTDLQDIRIVKISKEYNRILVASFTSVNIYNFQGEKIKFLTDSILGINDVSFIEKSKKIALMSFFGIKIYDINGEKIKAVNINKTFRFLFKDSTILCPRENEIYQYDFNGEFLKSYCCCKKTITDYIYSQTDNSIFAISGKELKKWRFNGEPSFSQSKHKYECNRVLYNDSSGEIFTTSMHEVLIWSKDGVLKDSYEFDFTILSAITLGEKIIVYTPNGLIEIKRKSSDKIEKEKSEPISLKEKVQYGLVDVNDIKKVPSLNETIELIKYLKENSDSDKNIRSIINKLYGKIIAIPNLSVEGRFAYLENYYREKLNNTDYDFTISDEKLINGILKMTSRDINQAIVILYNQFYSNDSYKSINDQILNYIELLISELTERNDYLDDISEFFIRNASMSLFFRNFDKAYELINVAKKTNHKKRKIAKQEPFIELFRGDKEKAVKLFKLWKDSTFQEDGKNRRFKEYYIQRLKLFEKMKMNSEHFDEIEKILQE